MADEIHLEIAPPDIASYSAGNRGIPYVTTFDSELPGPHAVVMALIHGNEICGAVALDHLFRAGGIRPARGRITLAFGNVEAYRRFDRRKPGASRYVDEDLNRVWAPSALDGHRASIELVRARQLRPVIDSADFLLDLHSMNDGRTPLLLAGLTEKTLAFARHMGAPAIIVRDKGHPAGPRLRDYGDFADRLAPRIAVLVECGQHWEKAAAEFAIAASLRFLAASGVLDEARAASYLAKPLPQRVIEVSETVVAASADFRFVADYRGLEIVPLAGTPIARDGARDIVTPYDECVLVMPSRNLVPGQTAVRLGRYTA